MIGLLFDILLQAGTVIIVIALATITTFFMLLIRVVPLIIVGLIRLGVAVWDAVARDRTTRRARRG